jgi:hypothetical protein
VREGRIGVAILALGAVLYAAPAAQATITVGSDLSHAVTDSVGGPITALSFNPSAVSPVNGTVVGFKVKESPGGSLSWGNVKARVLRPVGPTMFDGVGTSPLIAVPTTATANTIFSLPVQLPIAKGDSVGIDTGIGGNIVQSAPVAGATYGYWGPPLTDSAPPSAPTPGNPGRENLFNAQVDPSNVFTAGTPAILKKGKATVVVTVPNPGAISGGSSNDAGLAATAKKKKKKAQPLLARSSATAADAGPVTLTLSASKAGRKLLRDKGKLKTTAKIVYTPTGGSASTQTIQLKLKP